MRRGLGLLLQLLTFRALEHAEWVSDTLSSSLANIPLSTTVDIRIFLTNTADNRQAWDDDSVEDDSEEKARSKDLDPKILSNPLVQVQQGRPDLHGLLEKEKEQTSGAISVNGEWAVLRNVLALK